MSNDAAQAQVRLLPHTRKQIKKFLYFPSLRIGLKFGMLYYGDDFERRKQNFIMFIIVLG